MYPGRCAVQGVVNAPGTPIWRSESDGGRLKATCIGLHPQRRATHEDVLADENERRGRVGSVFLDFEGGNLGAWADLTMRKYRRRDIVSGVGDGCDGGGHDRLRMCRVNDRDQPF